MTASEVVSALRYAVWQIAWLRGPSVWQKLQLTFLKCVAVAGYHYGKWIAMHKPALQEALHRHEAPELDARVIGLLNGRVKEEMQASEQSGVAVVIPIFVREQEDVVRLFKAMEGLSAQERLPDLLVLVDDCGPLQVPAIMNGERVVVLRLTKNSGPATARNMGTRIARRLGMRYVAYLDADCVPEPDWLTVMVEWQAAAPGIICGRTMATQPVTAVGRYHDLCGTLNGRRFQDGSLLYGCTCNLSIDLRAITQEFDASFPGAAFEDVEFCVRARKAGLSLVYTEAAVVHHHYDVRWVGLFRQFQRYGAFEGLMCAKHGEYLTWLWSSNAIPSVPWPGSAGTPSDGVSNGNGGGDGAASSGSSGGLSSSAGCGSRV